MSTHRWRVRLLLVLAPGAVLAACTASAPIPQPLAKGGGEQSPVEAGVNPSEADAAAATVDPDPGGTTCVNGVAVLHGSALETGGTAPDLSGGITRATKPVPPLSGGTLLVLSDATTIAASDPERDQLYFVDSTRNVLRATVALHDGDEPGRLAEDAAGRVHVVLRRAGAVVTADPKTGMLSARRPACPAPRGIAYQKDADQLHVVCAGGEIVSLPAAGGGATRTLTFDRDLRDVVMGESGTLLVSTFRTAELLVIGADGKLTTRIRPGSGPVPALGGNIRMRTPSVAWRMVSLDQPTNRVVMLHQTGVTDIIDTQPGGYAGSNGCGSIVQVGVSILSPEGGSPNVATGFGVLPLAVDVALSPDHEKLAIAVPGNGVFQGPTLVERALKDATPGTPNDCTEEINGVDHPPTGQVVAVGYSPAGVLFAQTREPAAIWRSDTGATTTLASDPRLDTGHFLFHASSGAGLTCASCHPEGGEDGRTWSFVCAGARRTQSVRGGISATLPFHWDGSETDFARLVDDVFSGRMAGPGLSDEQKSAIEAWVDTIPPMPAVAGLDAAAVLRGKALFDDSQIGCANCHTGSLLTNNATIDVGTGRAFQVPSLRGVSWRAPFMHNGCAATLADRFGTASCGGGDKHGATSALQQGEIDDLVAYMQTL